jgi:site-specific recombinase XerD
VLLFLADTGCRVGGLVGLHLGDLDLGDRSALVTEKGGKSRYVFFLDPTRAALAAWLAVRPQGSDYVFVGQRGPLTVFGVNQLLTRLKHAAGVTGPVNPHAFRHGFAKRYLANGGDLASLSDLMGHTDVGVTKGSYAIFLTEELRRKHDQHVTLDALVAV